MKGWFILALAIVAATDSKPERVTQEVQTFDVSASPMATFPILPGLDAALAQTRNLPSVNLQLLTENSDFTVTVPVTIQSRIAISSASQAILFTGSITVSLIGYLRIAGTKLKTRLGDTSLSQVFEILGNSEFEGCSFEDSAIDFAILSGSLSLISVGFLRNTGLGVMIASGGSTLVISKCYVGLHSGTFLSVIRSVSGTVTLRINQTTFRDNASQGDNYLLLIANSNVIGSLNIINSVFQNNASPLFYLDIGSFSAFIVDSLLTQSHQIVLTLYGLGAHIEVTNTVFRANWVEVVDIRMLKGDFIISESSISECVFKGPISIGNTLAAQDCHFTLQTSRIFNAYFLADSQTPGALTSKNCLVLISKTSVIRAWFRTDGIRNMIGTFSATFGQFTIADFYLDSAGGSGGVIVSIFTDLTIRDSTIHNPNPEENLYITGTIGSVNITNVNMTDGWGYLFNREFLTMFSPFFFAFMHMSMIRIENVNLELYINVTVFSVPFVFGYSNFEVNRVSVKNLELGSFAAISLSQGSMTNVHIKNCTSMIPAWQFLGYSSLKLTNVIVEDSSVLWDARGFFSLSSNSTLEAENLYFNNVTATMFIASKMSRVTMKNVTVTNSNFDYLLRYPANSNIRLEDVQFKHSQGGLVIAANSDIRFRKCRFESLSASSYFVGGFASNITLENVVVRGVFAFLGLGRLLEQSNLTISTSSFTTLRSHNDEGFRVETGSVAIIDSSFVSFNVTLMQVVSASVTIRGSVFREGWNSVQSEKSRLAFGGVLGCHDCLQVSIVGSSMLNVSSLMGGAIAIINKMTDETTDLSISHCLFVMCQARSGGALFIQNASFTIESVEFVGNSAETTGGAADISIRESDNNQIKSCTFIRNSAREGGAVKWKSFEVVFKNVTFKDNSASYGPNIASYGVILSPNLTNLTGQEASGYPIRVIFEILDHYHQRVTTPTDKVLQLVTTSTISYRGNDVAISNDGVFNFSQLTIYAPPGSNQDIRAIVQAEGSSTIEGLLGIPFRKCKVGEIQKNDRCEYCFSGNVSFSSQDSECSFCPAHAFCPGGGELHVNPDYWRSAWNSTAVLKCPLEENCLGGVSSTCAAGYTGQLCNECREDYFRYRAIGCTPCNTTPVLWIELSLIMLPLLGFVLAVGAFAVRKRNKMKLFVVKQFINHSQLISAMCWLKVSFPPIIKHALHGITYISSLFVTDLPITCFVTSHPEFVRAIIGSILFPVLLLFFAAASSFRTQSFKHYFLVLATSAMLFTPTISISVVVPLLVCQKVDSDSEWLFIDMSVKCWEGLHWDFVKYLIAPSLVFNVLGPIVTVIVVSLVFPVAFAEYFPMWRSGYKWHSWDLQMFVAKAFYFGLLIASISYDKLSQLTYGIIVLIVASTFNVTLCRKAYVQDKLFFLSEASLLITAVCAGFIGYYIYHHPADGATDFFIAAIFLLLNVGYFVICAYLLIYPPSLMMVESRDRQFPSLSQGQADIIVPENSLAEINRVSMESPKQK